MNQGYGYSVWYVPENYTLLTTSLDIKHIPHVTYVTNLLYSQAKKVAQSSIHSSILIELDGGICVFPSMYTNDPLCAYGSYVSIIAPRSFYMDHKPHMSFTYWKRGELTPNVDILSQIPKDPMLCHIVIADTHDIDPVKWTIVP